MRKSLILKVLVLGIISIAMLLTRNVDWYALGAKRQGAVL